MPMSQVGLETNTWHKTGAQALAASRRRLTVSPALASASRMIFARASMACRIETLRSCPRPYHLTVRSVHQLIVPKDHRSKKRTVAHRLRRAHWLLSSQNKSLSQRVHPLFAVCKVAKARKSNEKIQPGLSKANLLQACSEIRLDFDDAYINTIFKDMDIDNDRVLVEDEFATSTGWARRGCYRCRRQASCGNGKSDTRASISEPDIEDKLANGSSGSARAGAPLPCFICYIICNSIHMISDAIHPPVLWAAVQKIIAVTGERG